MKTKSIGALLILGVIVAVSASCGGDSTPATYKFRDKAENVTYHNARNARNTIYGGGNDLTSTGRTLIIPVEFTDYQLSDLPSETRETGGAIKDIYNVNFGESSDTQWESLKSFYYKSSYGQANLTGIVTPVFNPYSENYETEGQLLSAKGLATEASGYSGAARVLRQAYTWLSKTGYKTVEKSSGVYYATAKELFQDMDSDKDGWIDNIQMVYTCHPLQKDSGGTAIDNELFWAFRTSTGYKANVETPTANNYLWLSYYTFYENGYYDNSNVYHDYTDADIASGLAKLDAHTIIHETGHALGLEDYYTNTSGDYDGCGKFIMMSHNIGDHDPFSKAAYGWTNPTVVLNSSEVTIGKSTSTGDAIIVPAKGSWTYDGTTNTLLDEYLMIEYYSPDGLNAFDTAHNYTNNTFYPKGPSKAGIKVWHVDARLGSFRLVDGTLKFIRYETSLVAVSNGFTYLAHSNDSANNKSSGVTNNKLLEIMRKDGKTTSSDGNNFDENYILGEGETFGVDAWSSLKLHNGLDFGYSFEVVSLGDTATIKFSAK